MVQISQRIIEGGFIKPGVKFVVLKEIPSLKSSVAPLAIGDTVEFLQTYPGSQYPGLFSVQTHAGPWLFHFGKNGGGNYFGVDEKDITGGLSRKRKVDMPGGENTPSGEPEEGLVPEENTSDDTPLEINEENPFEEKYGEIPYLIYKTLTEYRQLQRKELIDKVLREKMMVPMRTQKQVAYTIDEAVLKMYKDKYLDMTTIKGDGDPFFKLSEKGVEFFEGGVPS